MQVSLAIENPTGNDFQAHISVQLIDPDGVVQSTAERDEDLRKGSGKVQLSLPLPKMKSSDEAAVFWYRLRYEIYQSDARSAVAQGIISVSQVAPDIFELHLATPTTVIPGGHFRATVRAVQPVTLRPIQGVNLEAKLDVGEAQAKSPLASRAKTDSQGYASIEFLLPPKIDEDELDLTVSGSLQGFTATVEGDDTQVSHFSSFLVSTDKPLYQPGQTLHARILAFDPSRHAIADETVELRILDPDNTLVFRSNQRTSKFGIASADWPIPGNLRLGDYRIQADFGEDRSENGGAAATVKISRYELPTFTVSSKPDHAYYLLGQNARVEVRADYLFGQPVTHGHVRVVRETERTWNFREQKWETEDSDKYEGDTDSSGLFVANIDLSKEQKGFAENDYQRFRDLRYAAYFEDASSGRTEERRFDIRITKAPIHIYVIHQDGGAPSGPLDFYVSTSLADGMPANCEVTIWSVRRGPSGGPNLPETLLRTIHTNQFGVAKVTGLLVPQRGPQDEFSVMFQAQDPKGLSGSHSESFWRSDSSQLRVSTNKTLYRPGEPLEVKLTSDQPELRVEVQAVSEWRVLSSQTVSIKHGHGTAIMTTDERFRGDITLVAYALGLQRSRTNDDTDVSGSHTVFFPHDSELRLNAHLSKTTYRPGEEADADFRITSPDQSATRSAIGLVVVDKAVSERERTDHDFGPNSGFYSFRSYWDGDDEFAGLRRADLNKVDMSKPLPDGFELAAEILLQTNNYLLRFSNGEDFETNLRKIFEKEIDPVLRTTIEALRTHNYPDDFPNSDAGLSRFLEEANTGFDKSLDPWGTSYKATVAPQGAKYIVTISSAGPDKRFGTADDFTVATEGRPYFMRQAAAIQQALDNYHVGTGAYIRDEATLASELEKSGIALDSLRDPWGHAYRVSFGISRVSYTVTVTSAGPDGIFSSDAEPSSDDVTVSLAGINYFADSHRKIDAALERYYHDSGLFPQNLDELRKALSSSGIDLQSLLDPWGHPYYPVFHKDSRYSDSITVQSYPDYQAGQHTSVHPVTSEVSFVDIRSAGPDGKEGTEDDFDAGVFSRTIFEQSAQDAMPRNLTSPVLSGETGAISGTVLDPTGGVIPNARVLARRDAGENGADATTDNQGKFTLRNLLPGYYAVQFIAAGFRTHALTDVPVYSFAVTQVNVYLTVGSVSQVVEVEASRVLVETAASSVTSLPQVRVVTKSGTDQKSGLPARNQPLATPRLREYFPETLFWNPELVTDSQGKARLKFRLADSITTWKLSAIASTVDGEIGTADTEIRAFQPFFVDQDLPPFLTVGDAIKLPITVRNYLDQAESVEIQLAPSSWSDVNSIATKHSEIPPNDFGRAVFPIRAILPIDDGKQRVTATGARANDAIEKKVTVRPFGEQKTETSSRVFRDSTFFEISVPETALKGTVHTELKIYPNLMAHVLESIEAILERPYGCAEQTISSTYPSVLLLQYGKESDKGSSVPLARARRYVQLGYERLLSYRTSTGGFSYWGRGDADVAITAYALMFLHDARNFVPVDESVAADARTWLLNQAKPDGHWADNSYWIKDENQVRSALLTAYIARVLTMTRLETPGTGKNQLESMSNEALERALVWVKPHAEQYDEPYLIASYALALSGAGGTDDRINLDHALERLRSVVHTEGDGAYWSLETNTPFYGWGRAGRLETTALVIEALQRGPNQKSDDKLISRGLLFLLSNQDRYGIWYSTQATVNVLQALGSFVSENGGAQHSSVEPGKTEDASILVDGKLTTHVTLPAVRELSPPITTDLSRFVSTGVHRIEIQRSGQSSQASGQIVATYYVPWDSTKRDRPSRLESSDALELRVHYDKTTVGVGDVVSCEVTAKRIGFSGYGMMLAEVGLPPGAEVDRSSLEHAMSGSAWDINQYDVLPDRLIFYIWPHAGGTTFSFSFRPRFGLSAETTPSVLYDYYNPDASSVVMPTEFVVQ